ncbi:MAG TPA: hypothetical protein VGP07_20775 [Polyangia bacterium]
MACGGGGKGTGGSGGTGSASSGGATSPSTGGTAGDGATGGAKGGSGGQGSGGMPGSGGAPRGTGGGQGSGGTAGQGGAPAGTPAGSGGASGGGGASSTVLGSDEFDGTSLDPSWTVFRPDLADIAVADGALSIAPHTSALWYQTSQADLVYKLVTGDFKATATVHARRASDRSQTPNQFADVGGFMARAPTGTSENYVLGVVGWAEMNQLAAEHKSTTNGSSVYGESAFAADAELLICRAGTTITIYYRHPGDTGWSSSFAPFVRPDLPATLQVGLIAYTGSTAPDFVAIFDRAAFAALGTGCTD